MACVERLMNLVVELVVGECLASYESQFYTILKHEGKLEICLDGTNVLIHSGLCLK